jgi:hypothetical protein
LTHEELRTRHRRRSRAAAWSPHDLPTDLCDLPYDNELLPAQGHDRAELPRLGQTHRLVTRNGRRRSEGRGQPVFVSPLLMVPPDIRDVAPRGGQVMLADCRAVLREAAERLPVDAVRLTGALYESVRREVGGPCRRQISYAARRNGTSFEKLAWEMLWEVRGQPAPPRVPSPKRLADPVCERALRAAAERTDPRVYGTLTEARYLQLLPHLPGYPDIPHRHSINAWARRRGSTFAAEARAAMAEVWGPGTTR